MARQGTALNGSAVIEIQCWEINAGMSKALCMTCEVFPSSLVLLSL